MEIKLQYIPHAQDFARRVPDFFVDCPTASPLLTWIPRDSSSYFCVCCFAISNGGILTNNTRHQSRHTPPSSLHALPTTATDPFLNRHPLHPPNTVPPFQQRRNPQILVPSLPSLLLSGSHSLDTTILSIPNHGLSDDIHVLPEQTFIRHGRSRQNRSECCEFVRGG